MSKEVAKQETRDLVFGNQDEFFDGLGNEDYSVPFTRVLADLSAQVKEGEFQAGMIYNSGTGEAAEKIQIVVVKKTEKTITVKTDDGEFVASYPWSAEKKAELTVKQEGLKCWDKDDNGVFDTLNYYIMNIETGDISICPMLSSNYAVGKAWNSRMRMLKPGGKKIHPFQMVWELGTMEKPNGKKSYWKFDVPRFVRQITEEETETVKEAIDMLQTAKVDHSKGFEKETETVNDSDF